MWIGAKVAIFVIHHISVLTLVLLSYIYQSDKFDLGKIPCDVSNQ